MKKSLYNLALALVAITMLISACGSAATLTPQVIKETVVVNSPAVKETVVVQSDPITVKETIVVTQEPVKEVLIRTTNAAMANDKVQLARQTYLTEAFRALRPDVLVNPSPYQYDPQTFAARLAAGTMEDTFLVAWTEPKTLIANGYVAPITSYVKDWAPLADIKPEYLSLVQDDKGEIYGIPVYANVLGLLYRRDLFTKAGLDPNKPPQTWDELKADCEIIKAALPDVACFGIRNEGGLAGWMSFAVQASFGQDANLTTADGINTAAFNNKSMVAAFTLWKELYDAGYMPTSLAWGNVPQVQDFSAGKVVMTIADGGTLSWMKDNMGSFPGVEKFDLSDVGMGRLPDGGGNGSLGGGNMWMYNINSTPEAVEASVAWNLWRDFDLTAYEQDLKTRAEAGAVIGYPEVQIFGGEYGAKRAEILAKYANAPTANYENYNASPVTVMGEPAVKANEMKDALGLALQTILTTDNADVQAILDAAVATFQQTVLDVAK